MAAAGVGAVAITDGLALAIPGAALAGAPSLRIVFPVCHRTKDQPADRDTPGEVIEGSPIIERRQRFLRKTNLD
jgi:hypothetical protein